MTSDEVQAALEAYQSAQEATQTARAAYDAAQASGDAEAAQEAHDELMAAQETEDEAHNELQAAEQAEQEQEQEETTAQEQELEEIEAQGTELEASIEEREQVPLPSESDLGLDQDPEDGVMSDSEIAENEEALNDAREAEAAVDAALVKWRAMRDSVVRGFERGAAMYGNDAEGEAARAEMLLRADAIRELQDTTLTIAELDKIAFAASQKAARAAAKVAAKMPSGEDIDSIKAKLDEAQDELNAQNAELVELVAQLRNYSATDTPADLQMRYDANTKRGRELQATVKMLQPIYNKAAKAAAKKGR